MDVGTIRINREMKFEKDNLHEMPLFIQTTACSLLIHPTNASHQFESSVSFLFRLDQATDNSEEVQLSLLVCHNLRICLHLDAARH